MYKVVYSERATNDLQSLEKLVVVKIMDRVEKYLAQDPQHLGEPLSGDFQGYWRYRWGVYRVIYKISQKEILIVVLRIGHRKDIYN